MRTCLIAQVQVSPADLNDLRVILADVKLLQHHAETPDSKLFPIPVSVSQPLVVILEQILFQCRISSNVFNCYLLIKLLAEYSYILSDFQLGTDQATLDYYHVLRCQREKLMKFRDKLINPF